MKKKEPNSLDLAMEAAAHLKSLEESYKGKATDPAIQQTITNLTAALYEAIEGLRKENPVEAQNIADAALQEAQTRYQEDYTNPLGDATKRQQIKNLKKLSEETAKAAQKQQTTVQPNTQQPDQPNAPTTPGQQQPQGQGVAQTNATPNTQQTATQPTQTTTQTTQQEQQQAQRAAERDASIAAAQKANKENLANLQAAKEAKAERATQVSRAAKIIVDTKIKQNKIQANTEQREVMERALQGALNVNPKLDPKEYYGIMSKAYNDNLIERAHNKAIQSGKDPDAAEEDIREIIKKKNEEKKKALAEKTKRESKISFQISQKEPDLDKIIGEAASKVNATIEQSGSFTAAQKEQNTAETQYNLDRKRVNSALDKSTMRQSPLFNDAVNKARLDLIAKNPSQTIDRYTDEQIAKLNKDAEKQAIAALQSIRKSFGTDWLSSKLGIKNSFDKLSNAKKALEEKKETLKNVITKLKETKSDLAEMQKVRQSMEGNLGIKEGQSFAWKQAKAAILSPEKYRQFIKLTRYRDTEKKLQEELMKESKAFDQATDAYEKQLGDFNKKRNTYNNEYSGKITDKIGELTKPKDTKLEDRLRKHTQDMEDKKYKEEERHAKHQNVLTRMANRLSNNATTEAGVSRGTAGTAKQQKQKNRDNFLLD